MKLFYGAFLASLAWVSFAQTAGGDAGFRDYYQRRDREATDLYGHKQYAAAAAVHEEIRRNPALARDAEANLHVLYNLACEYSLAGEKEKALVVLREAVAAGADSVSIGQDSDFEPIRKEPAYRQIMAELEVKERPARLLWNSPALRTPYRENLPEDEKIAGLSRLWSEAKFNFVYFDRLGAIDWDGLYLSYLPKVRGSKSTYEYYRLLAEFCAHLKDGHSDVSFPREVRDKLGWPMLTTALVEGRVLVRFVRDPELAAQGVKAGMEITAVDDVPVKQYGAERVAPYRGASTPQDLAIKTFEYSLLGGPLDTPVKLTLRDAAGGEITRTLPRRNGDSANRYPGEPWKAFEFKVLPGNIAYVSLRSFGDETCSKQFAANFEAISKTDGIIFDVRDNSGGSSGVGWEILGYLTDQPFQSTRWSTREYRPAERAWGRAERRFADPGYAMSPHGGEPYRKPVIVLAGPRTFSAAEDFAAVFDAMKRGRIVGEPTGGSTGQPLSVPLPGGGAFRICTKHDSYPDGKEFVGVGIQPQVVAQMTVEDYRAGRDTVLETALKLLR